MGICFTIFYPFKTVWSNMYKGQTINEMKIFISKVSSAFCLISSIHLLVSFIKECFYRRHRQRGRMLVLRLSISSSQGFYKKIASSKIEFDEDLMNLS